jgi:hypothetical protein
VLLRVIFWQYIIGLEEHTAPIFRAEVRVVYKVDGLYGVRRSIRPWQSVKAMG